MTISVHQPQYIPWLGYFHKIYHSDAFVFLDNVQYKKREYQNRNRIRTKEGWIWLTVPVVDEKSYPNLADVHIDNSKDWRKAHWQSIYLNYTNAQFFKEYRDFFESLYKTEWDRLVDLNIFVVKNLMQFLGIDKPIYLASTLDVKTENTRRIVDICKKLGADTYLSGIGGKDYLEEELFSLRDIKLIYQNFEHPKYKQRYESFVPYLSIIDLLFNYGKDSLNILTNEKIRRTVI